MGLFDSSWNQTNMSQQSLTELKSFYGKMVDFDTPVKVLYKSEFTVSLEDVKHTHSLGILQQIGRLSNSNVIAVPSVDRADMKVRLECATCGEFMTVDPYAWAYISDVPQPILRFCSNHSHSEPIPEPRKEEVLGEHAPRRFRDF